MRSFITITIEEGTHKLLFLSLILLVLPLRMLSYKEYLGMNYVGNYPFQKQSTIYPLGILAFLSGRHKYELPVEIWLAIFEIVVQYGLTSYEDCTSLDFPRFLANWEAANFPKDEGLRNLRLVCRTWAQMIDSRLTPHLKATSLSSIIGRIGIQTLHVANRPNWLDQNVGLHPLNLDIFLATRNITTLVISRNSSKLNPTMGSEPTAHSVEGQEPRIDIHIDFLKFLLSRPKYFPNLRSLSFHTTDDLSPDFWKQLEEGFPQLVALRISGRYAGTGIITLPHLAILDIGLSSPPTCSFPSLRHLCVNNCYLEPYSELLLRHGPSLESLVLLRDWPDSHLGYTRHADHSKVYSFEKTFPNLRLFGTNPFILFDMEPPPPTHPLNNIWLLDSWNEPHTHIYKIVDHFANIQYLTYGSSIYMSSMSKYFFSRTCRQAGITHINITPFTYTPLYESGDISLFPRLADVGFRVFHNIVMFTYYANLLLE